MAGDNDSLVIVTPRLLLRPFGVADARAVLSGDRARRSWADGYPTEGDREIAQMILANPPQSAAEVAFGPRQIVLRESGEAIGGIGFFGPPDESGTIGVGYGVAPEVRGQGITTEAVLAMLDFAAQPGVRRVVADTLHDNLASQRVLEKAGFRRVRSDDELHYYELELPRPPE